MLKKAQKKLIMQREAAGELGLSERQVKRVLIRLPEVGDRARCSGTPASMTGWRGVGRGSIVG